VAVRLPAPSKPAPSGLNSTAINCCPAGPHSLANKATALPAGLFHGLSSLQLLEGHADLVCLELDHLRDCVHDVPVHREERFIPTGGHLAQ
jgi:hypothetical protein